VTRAEESLARLVEARRPGGPAFLRALHAAGRDTFLRVMLPTTRHEDWRYTSLSALVQRSLVLPPPAARGDGRGEGLSLPPAPRLVFLNGRLDPALTDLCGLPAGACAGGLAAALDARPAAIEPHLGLVVPAPDHAFAALNAALFEDGALVEIGEGVGCERPIHLVFIAADGERAGARGEPLSVLAPRTLVIVGPRARATIVEHHRGEGAYLSAPVTELALAEGAEVEHDRVQEDGAGAFHMGLVHVGQGARTHFTGQSIALGGAVARVEARVRLSAEGAACDLHGLYVGAGRQVLDHLVHVDHASPHATSRQLFKGILDGASKGVFAGRVVVRQDAQKTDAGQVNSNLLLSDEATVDTKPQLEILADDVKCSHGGTVGQIREDQLFYLRSRGVPAALARALLTWAFASEMVDRVGPEDVRARVRRAVTARLPSGELLREVA
jgi:Fe-S cluster assembly protein SufD